LLLYFSNLLWQVLSLLPALFSSFEQEEGALHFSGA